MGHCRSREVLHGGPGREISAVLKVSDHLSLELLFLLVNGFFKTGVFGVFLTELVLGACVGG